MQVPEFIEKAKQKKAEKSWLPRVHHILMKEYGWIPYEEFKKLPLPVIWNLLEQIKEQHEAEKREVDKMKSKSRRR